MEGQVTPDVVEFHGDGRYRLLSSGVEDDPCVVDQAGEDEVEDADEPDSRRGLGKELTDLTVTRLYTPTPLE